MPMRNLFYTDVETLGEGKVLFEWNPKGNFLACCGSKRKMNILDRNGRLYDEIHFPPSEIPTGDVRAPAASILQWDPAGEQLAMLPNGNTFVYIWSAISKEVHKIDTEFKTAQELTTMAWSKTGMYLAVGTAKGNLLLYNSRERKKTPYLGKHTKKVVCMAWNKDNHLAMAGADKIVTITDAATGETIRQFPIKADPVDMCVSTRKEDGYAKNEENTYSINVGGKTIYIMECSEQGDKPVELAFEDKYGAIRKHAWFGDGYILVAFKTGQVVVVSSHTREMAEEVFSSKLLDNLSDVSVSAALARVVMGGGYSIRLMDVSGTDFDEIKSDAIDLEGGMNVERVGWTRDGQVLTISTREGHLFSYLAALPVVFDYHASKVIYLTSLLEMSVVDVKRRGAVCKINIETEPTFCGLGPTHAAIGMNNQVWFYRLGQGGEGKLVNRRDYMGSVSVIKLGPKQAAVLSEGKVIVHPIEVEGGKNMDDYDTVLPAPGQNQTLTCVAITPTFIITGSKQGIISYYLAEDVSPVNEYRHDDGAVLRLYPQPDGARMVFEDERGNICLFNPVNDQVLAVPWSGGRSENVMWDVSDPNIFAVAEQGMVYVYLYLPVSIAGARVEMIGKQAVSPAHTPLSLSAGSVGCRLKNGALDNILLDTHRALNAGDAIAKAQPQRRFLQNLKLGRLRGAWECAVAMRNAESWSQLGVAALELLDIDMAIAAYRMLGDASMVLSLERVRQYEDKNLLAAHVMVLLDRDHNTAQELFLRSSNPKAALEMRKDLKHWSEALKLAEQLDPDAIASISKEHAASLEMTGEYSQAKTHYQQAMESLSTMRAGVDTREVELACRAGIARCLLQLGDIRQGRGMVLQLNSQQLFKESALILEGLSQMSEAAEMYERAGQFERACAIYIQAKNFTAAAPLMARISSSKLQLQFAKAKESEGRYVMGD